VVDFNAGTRILRFTFGDETCVNTTFEVETWDAGETRNWFVIYIYAVYSIHVCPVLVSRVFRIPDEKDLLSPGIDSHNLPPFQGNKSGSIRSNEISSIENRKLKFSPLFKRVANFLETISVTFSIIFSRRADKT